MTVIGGKVETMVDVALVMSIAAVAIILGVCLLILGKPGR